MNKERQHTAGNERFGASGGVTPQKVLCVNESLSPATLAVSPPPSPSRRTLYASRFFHIKVSAEITKPASWRVRKSLTFLSISGVNF
jgi:hypothetical protein